MPNPLTRKRIRRRRQHLESEQIKQTLHWFTLGLVLVSWVSTTYIFLFIDPTLIKDTVLPDLYLPFFISLAISLGTSLYVLFRQWNRTCLYTSAIILFLYLQLFHSGTLLNTGLLVALLVVIEVLVIRQPHKPDNL